MSLSQKGGVTKTWLDVCFWEWIAESLYTLCLTTEKIADQHDEQARALFALANGLTQMGNAEDKTTDVRTPTVSL